MLEWNEQMYICFDSKIEEIKFPNNLHTLKFCYWSNHELKENVLPINLHTLIFGNCYNQKIKENVLPINLHTLTFGDRYTQEIKENVLPINLHTLTFGEDFKQEIKENVLPKSIKKISLYSHYYLINNLPLHLDEVYILFCFNDIFNKEITNLPMTLKKITIFSKKNLKYITKIPFGCVVEIDSSF